MTNNQMTTLDNKTTGLKIERIYTTRGDNMYDCNGIKNDKCVGVVIGGLIHWINASYATISELSNIVAPLNISLSDGGVWGMVDEYGCATLDQKVTKISKHQDDIFDKKSSYMKRTAYSNVNSIWWSTSDIRAKLAAS